MVAEEWGQLLRNATKLLEVKKMFIILIVAMFHRCIHISQCQIMRNMFNCTLSVQFIAHQFNLKSCNAVLKHVYVGGRGRI